MIEHFYKDGLGTALGTDGGLVVDCDRRGGILRAAPLSVFYTGNYVRFWLKKGKLIIVFFSFKR